MSIRYSINSCPAYEVVERHQVHVGAPANIAFAVATELDLSQSPVIRAIFRTRELILGSEPEQTPVPRAVLAIGKPQAGLFWRRFPAARL